MYSFRLQSYDNIFYLCYTVSALYTSVRHFGVSATEILRSIACFATLTYLERTMTHIKDFGILPSTGGDFSLELLQQGSVILYFYPRDFTGGCTLEGQDFARLHSDFVDLGYRIFGVSPDDLASHESFAASLNLPFDLVCDLDEDLAEAFDTFELSANGITGETIRSTFVFENGRCVQEWRGVSASGHAEAVLE